MAEYTPGWSKSATKMGSVCSVGMPWKTGYISGVKKSTPIWIRLGFGPDDLVGAPLRLLLA